MVNEEILKKLTTRNIIALSTVGVFLGLAYQIGTDPTQIATTVKNNPELSVAGALILGALVVKVGDIYQFFFRKPQKKES